MFLEWENNSGKLKIISGKFLNNPINNVKQISLGHVINKEILLCVIVDDKFQSSRGLNTHRRSCYVGDMPDIRDLLIGELEERNIGY